MSSLDSLTTPYSVTLDLELLNIHLELEVTENRISACRLVSGAVKGPNCRLRLQDMPRPDQAVVGMLYYEQFKDVIDQCFKDGGHNIRIRGTLEALLKPNPKAAALPSG